MRSFSHEPAVNVVARAQRLGMVVALLLLSQAASCLLGPQPARAADGIPISIQGNWPDKFTDSLRYRRVSATKYPDGRRTLREYLATIEIAVHARRGNSTMLSWKYTHMSVNGEPLADLALELSVTSDGDVKLLNLADLRRKVLQAASTKAKSSKPFDFGSDELARTAANKDALSIFYLRDAVIFFYPQGVTMRRDQPVEFDNEIEGLDGDTLKAVNRWTVLPDRDIPAGTIPIEWTQDVDRRDVERYFSALGKAVGMKIDADKGLLTKKGLYALDRSTFWPHVVLATTKASVLNDYEQFDSLQIRSSLLDPNWKH
jgi:hypothetical protein